MRHIARFSVLAAALAGSLAAAAGASADSFGSFSVGPAHFNANVSATRAYFKPAIARGNSFSDQVMVANNGDQPITLRVYPVDGVTGVTAGAVYANRQNRRREAGRWVQSTTALVQVPARSQVAVGFSVRVPASAKSGDHLAGLAFEDARVHQSGGQLSVREVIREVVGIDIKVPGPAKASLRLYGVRLKTLPGTSYSALVIRLGNTGTELCKPRLAVTLTGPGGRVHLFRRLDTVLPGDRIPYPWVLPRTLPAGHYTSTVRARGCGHRVRMKRASDLHTSLAGTGANRFSPPPSAPGSKFPGVAIALASLVGFASLAGLAGLGTGLPLPRRHRLARQVATS
ncbi:MAG TPA: DUF916 domain-containing protein [Solirubrobacteraceae bacterium]|nr:DUF916 domain-containing protein [Solirubrobacteraceae bacterium]